MTTMHALKQANPLFFNKGQNRYIGNASYAIKNNKLWSLHSKIYSNGLIEKTWIIYDICYNTLQLTYHSTMPA